MPKRGLMNQKDLKYWNDSDHDEAKIVNFTRNIENKAAQIVMIKADYLLYLK